MTTQSNFPLPADFQGFVLWDKMHCPIVSREYGMPCVVGTPIGTNALKDDKRGGDILRCEGGTMIALKADLFQEMGDFLSWSDEMSQRVHAVPPAPGFDGVLMPGDPEANARESRRHDGIPIEDDVWATIVEACEMFGITDL